MVFITQRLHNKQTQYNTSPMQIDLQGAIEFVHNRIKCIMSGPDCTNIG